MAYEPDTADVAEELLHNLRGRLGTDAVDYSEAPERIHGGFDTFIYGFSLRGAPPRFSGRLILRLYRPDTDPRQACFESTIQNVLSAAGYPSPPVLLVGRAGDGLGLPFVVMPRVPGRLMLDTLWGPTAIRMSTTLARAQTALHPLNVLVDGGRISGVIDWSERRLRLGDPAYDVGATVAILSHGRVNAPELLA